jgi:hypothetical protein
MPFGTGLLAPLACVLAGNRRVKAAKSLMLHLGSGS